jgi:hypothetical protein
LLHHRAERSALRSQADARSGEQRRDDHAFNGPNNGVIVALASKKARTRSMACACESVQSIAQTLSRAQASMQFEKPPLTPKSVKPPRSGPEGTGLDGKDSRRLMAEAVP